VTTSHADDQGPVEVGVGPWPGEWPTQAWYDPDLLREGDRRNVVDAYPFHVAVENWGHDFNIGSVVRTANAFNAAAVHIVGERRWNRRGAMVTDRYQHVLHHPTVDALVSWTGERDLPLLGIDNLPGSVPLETYPLPAACVLVFGQEGPGLSPEVRGAATATLSIAQFGSTRSINAGAAAAVAMHAWVRRHAFGQEPGPASA